MPYLGKQPARVPVTAADIPDDSITAAKILDGVITAEDIGAGEVDTAELANDAVTEDKLADAINTAIAANTAKVTNATHTGDVTGSGALTIANDAVDSQHYAAASIDNEHLADNAVDTEEIADNAITLAKMAGGTDGNIISFDANGDPVAIATGSDGQVLTSAGANAQPAFEALPASGATELDDLSDCNNHGNQSVGVGAGTMALAGSGNYYCAAFGYYALRQAGGSDNVAMGWKAGANSYVHQSVMIGSGSACGGASGSNKSGISIGYQAGSAQSGAANNNVLVGRLNMQQGPCTGTDNVAVGNACMWTAGDGNYNTGIGSYATLYYLDSGDYNSAVGNGAGNAITTGSNNSCIGHDSDAPSATTSNSFNLGNGNISNLRCNDTSISSLSDERDKAEIEDLPDSEGLAFINKLKPRTFYWDRREWYEDGNPDGSKIKRNSAPWLSNAGKRMGFVAQEVQEAIGSSDCMDEIVNTENSDKLEFGLGYLVTPLVKSIQELTSKIEELEAKITTLEEA